MIGWIARIMAGLYSNRKPAEVAAAVSTALLLTFLPGANLLWFTIFVAMFFLRVNHAIALLTLALLAPLSATADPLLHNLGHIVLTNPSLADFFTALYNQPLMPFTRFNNTLVMGGLLAGAIVWFPVFLLSRIAVMTFRLRLVPALASSKPVRALVKVPLVARLTGATRHWAAVYQALR